MTLRTRARGYSGLEITVLGSGSWDDRRREH